MSNYKTDWAEYDGWKPEDVQIHKDTDWGKRNYEELVVPEDNFEGEAVLYTLDGKYVEPVKFVKHIRPNPIYPPYYAPEENPFEVSHVGFMYDGTSHNGYDVHDRAESQEVYDMLSEKLYSEEDDEQDTWEFLKSKSVQDFDGFYTDYSMYFNHDTGMYGFVLGDNEIYGPENTELDWEESQLPAAEEWFDSYTGYEDYPDDIEESKEKASEETLLEDETKDKVLTDWESIQKQLQAEVEDGLEPLYKDSDAGQYIVDLCMDIESDASVQLEASIRGGKGSITVYAPNDQCIAKNIDFQAFNEDTINLVLDSESEEDFKSSYRAFLKNTIDSHACDESLSRKMCEAANSNTDLPSLYDYKINNLSNLRWSNDEVSSELAQKIKDLAKLLDETYALYQEQILKPKEEAKRKSEEERISNTGLTIPLTQAQADLCDVVLGQLSDGYWENNSYYDPFWKNIHVKGTNLVIDMERLRYAKSGDRFKKDVEELSTPEGAKRWFAKKAQIVQNEDLKYQFGTTQIKGHEDEQAKFLDRGVNQTLGQVQAAIDSIK